MAQAAPGAGEAKGVVATLEGPWPWGVHSGGGPPAPPPVLTEHLLTAVCALSVQDPELLQEAGILVTTMSLPGTLRPRKVWLLGRGFGAGATAPGGPWLRAGYQGLRWETAGTMGPETESHAVLLLSLGSLHTAPPAPQL